MSVGQIRLRPFRSIQLRELYAGDLQGDTLLYVDHLSAGFRLLPLLKGRLTIRSVDLDDFTVNLRRADVGAPLNLQFLIDAFASSDTTKTSGGLVVEIDDIRLARGRFSYEVLSVAPRDSIFNPGCIRIRDLEAHIRLPSIDMKRLDIAIERLSFRERSGLTLENFSFAVTSDREVVTLSDLELSLPRSLLKIPHATIDYTGMPLSRLVDSAQYTLSLDVPRFRLSDIKAFAFVLSKFPDEISLRSRLSGRFPLAKIDSMQLAYGDNLQLNFRASLADYMRWYDAPLELHIPLLEIKPAAVAEIGTLTKDGVLPVDTRGVRLKADIIGTLPDLRLHLSGLSAPSGKFSLDGSGGWVFRTGETRFDLSLSADDFDLKTLLKENPLFGTATLRLKAAGHMNGNGEVDVRADLNVDKFDFRQYAYRDVTVMASYVGHKADLRLISRDPYAPVTIKADVDLSRTPSARLYLKTAHLMPDKLNLTPKYKDADLFAVLNADIRGFDLENMSANLSLDSVHFTTSKGTAALDPVRLTYEATSDRRKTLHLRSTVMNVDATGQFSLKTVPQSFQNTLAAYFPEFVESKKKSKSADDRLTVSASMRNAERWAYLLGLPFAIIDTAKLKVEYSALQNHMALEADFPKTRLDSIILYRSRLSLRVDTADRTLHLDAGTVRFGAADTMHLGLNLRTMTDSLHLGAKFDVFMPGVRLGGELALEAAFAKAEGRKFPNLSVYLFPAILRLNSQDLHVNGAHFQMKGDDFAVDDFEIALSDTEYLKAAGRVSRNEADTLHVRLAGIRIETLTAALQSGINLKGEINGEIAANRLFTSPRILTEGLSVKDIHLNDQLIGTLWLNSAWSKDVKGLLVNAELTREGARSSTIGGSIFPQRDSLALNAHIDDVELKWLNPFVGDFLFGLGGVAGVRIRADGKLRAPALSGVFTLKDANVGVKLLNTQYRISDSIQIRPDRFVMNNFRIVDENRKQAAINGEVQHSAFSNFRPSLAMKFADFLLLNNPKQTDGLFYGTLRADGSVDVSGSDKDLLLKVAVKNGADAKIFVNLPEGKAEEARQYKIVTFVGRDTLRVTSGNMSETATAETMKMPVKLQLAVEVTPEFQLGAIYNPKTKDAATVKGAGKIDFAYDMNNSKMNLLGEYKVSEGTCNVSLKNIATRTFIIQPGGTITFKGDPSAAEFDVTAVYKLRADILTLDPSFAADNLPRTRVNTECRIRVSGSIDKMTVAYSVVFPDEDEGVQRKADALMATDDIRLREIAYLLVAGVFYPVAETGSTKPTGSIWTSLASSAITTSLNSLLEGVLSDNWTIGTELRSDDTDDNSNLEVGVNISTSLFNNRLIFSSNIGYKNSTTNADAASDANTNFTGDFDVRYKLTKTGNLVIKMYNVTNDQYYEQARTTQGVGLMYRRESKRFRDLFKRTNK